ncbi:MAG: VWA domain-containing protein [Pirellulaceae bacterium]
MNILEFANPAAWWWALLALPIIGLYILKVRLRRVPATTLLFWNQLYDDKKPRSWWQRLRHWLSLLLQLAFLLLLVSALVDPLWSWQKEQRRNIVLVLDNSASMQASSEGGTSRLASAKAAAQSIVRSLRDGDQMAIVAAGGRPRVVWGMTNHAPWLSDAIAELPATDSPAQLETAVEMARRLLAGLEGEGETVVISDGCSGDLESLQGDEAITMYGVGESSDNVGITRYQVRRSLTDATGYEVLVDVTNFSDQATSCRLELDLEGELVDVLPLELDAEETVTRIINHTSAAGGRMQATLDVEDSLSVDNRAVAILPTRDPIPVRLATDGNLFASSVLRSIPLVDLSVIPAVDASTSNDASNPSARARNVTATPIQVFDRSVPEKLPPGRVFVIDPQNDCDLWTLGDSIGQPLVAAVDTDSPLTQHVRLDNVLFPGAKQIEFKAPAEALIRDPYDAPLLARLRRPGGDVILLTCNLSEGDLPLRIAFPVLMKNTIEWFAGDSGELQAAAAAGELIRLNAETLTQVTQTGGSDSQPLTSATDRDRPESVTADEQATVENPTEAREGDLERRRAAGSEPVILTSAQPASASNRLELVDPTGKASPVAIGNGRIVLGPLLHTGVWKLRAVRETRTGTGPDSQSIEELNPSATDTERDTAAGADATSDENSGDETRREREDSEGEDSETVGANAEDAEDGAIRLLACNLVSTEESDLRPKVELPRAEQLGMTLLGGRSIWFYLTLLAVTLIATEWWLYQRRIIG